MPWTNQPKACTSADTFRGFHRAATLAVAFFTLLLTAWATYVISTQTLWLPIFRRGLRNGITFTGPAATLAGLAILSFTAAYASHSGLRMRDGWEHRADRIAWFAAVAGLLLLLAACATQWRVWLA